MRYAVMLLLLSGCASVPESPTGTDYAGDSTIGPGNWGYAQGTALAAGAPCFYPGYPTIVGPSYSSSYNCATPLLFYARSPYLSYYSALTPVVHAHRTHAWRHRPLGTSAGATTTVVRASSGSAKKRK